MTKPPKRPRDANQLARMVVDLATGEKTERAPESLTPAQEIARAGGNAGGRPALGH
jgi:hypothetical protein